MGSKNLHVDKDFFNLMIILDDRLSNLEKTVMGEPSITIDGTDVIGGGMDGTGMNGITFPADIDTDSGVSITVTTNGSDKDVNISLFNASSIQAGVVQFATLQDILDGAADNKIVSPAVIKEYIEA